MKSLSESPFPLHQGPPKCSVIIVAVDGLVLIRRQAITDYLIHSIVKIGSHESCYRTCKLHHSHQTNWINGLMQGCSNSNELAMELPWPCINPFIHRLYIYIYKSAVTPLLTHRSYFCLALSHRYICLKEDNTLAGDALAPGITRSSADILMTVYVICPCLPWGGNSTTYTISILRNDRKCQHTFVAGEFAFLLQ